MTVRQDNILQIALAKTKGVNPEILRAMSEIGLAPSDFFSLGTADLGRLLGLREKDYILRADRDTALEEARKEYDFISRNSIRSLLLGTPGYPRRLAEIPDAPLMLYALGDADLDPERSLAVVGTRRATPYGEKMCRKIVEETYQNIGSTTIISGLASGTDSTAHTSAIDTGIPTIAVLAHGLDRIYPAANRPLAVDIVRSGGVLVTEYGINTHPYKRSFLERNRIIAGLADMTLVIESAIRGGAMSTARCAFEYSREVGAVPGRASDEMSAGCNHLIRRQQASLIESSDDIAAILGWKAKPSTSGTVQKVLFQMPEGDGALVIQTLKLAADPLAVDEIIRRTGIGAAKITGLLCDLEFDGFIQRYPGNRYSPSL